jgi:hypothetical protein
MKRSSSITGRMGMAPLLSVKPQPKPEYFDGTVETTTWQHHTSSAEGMSPKRCTMSEYTRKLGTLPYCQVQVFRLF